MKNPLSIEQLKIIMDWDQHHNYNVEYFSPYDSIDSYIREFINDSNNILIIEKDFYKKFGFKLKEKDIFKSLCTIFSYEEFMNLQKKKINPNLTYLYIFNRELCKQRYDILSSERNSKLADKRNWMTIIVALFIGTLPSCMSCFKRTDPKPISNIINIDKSIKINNFY